MCAEVGGSGPVTPAVPGGLTLWYLPGAYYARRGRPALAFPAHTAGLLPAQGADQRHSGQVITTLGRQSGAPETAVVIPVLWVVPVPDGGADVPLMIVPRAAPQDAHRRPHTSRGFPPRLCLRCFFQPAPQQLADFDQRGSRILILSGVRQLAGMAQPHVEPPLVQHQVSLE